MALKIYVEIAGRRYQLPVNPTSIETDNPNANETTAVVSLGEVSQLLGNNLKTVKFESFFPLDSSLMYVEDGSTYLKPVDYVALFEQASNSRKPVRLIVTDTKINMLASIDAFSSSIVDSTGDHEYSVTFKEYREYNVKLLKNIPKPVVKPKPKPQPPKAITIGCKVIVNGRLHRDSYGTGPGQTEVNAARLVNFIAKGRKCPYHVTNLAGGWRGWVEAGAVRRV